MNFFKKTITLVMALVLLNILLFGVLWLMSGGIDKNLSQVSALADELSIQLNKEKQLKEFKRAIVDTEEEREKLNSFFIPSDDIVSFIKEIESIASLSGTSLEINSVVVSDYVVEEKESLTLEILSMDLGTEGSWSGGFYFLNLLEAMPYKIVVDKFSLIAKQNPEGETLKWEGIIGIKVLKIK